MNKKDFYLASLLLATTSITSFTSLSASAFTISSGKVSDITPEDINKSFTIRFEGIVDGKDILGLSSKANLKLTKFTTFDRETIAAFDVLLKNTSDGIKSRVSVFGFNTNSTITNASAEGFFSTAVLDGSLPNNLGSADVCFNSGGNTRNCKNSYGGVRNKNSELFSLEIIFDPGVIEFELADFVVRYQGIKGLDRSRKGVGFGSITEIPEPSTNAALALLTVGSLGWLTKKSKQ